MAVTRAERKMQRKAQQRVLERSDPMIPTSMENTKENHSYWITGYYWDHDTIIIEPFCAVRVNGAWAISNLSKYDIGYYEATQVIEGKGSMFIYEDRVAALVVCEALENELHLLSSFSEYMTDAQLIEYLQGKEGKNA